MPAGGMLWLVLLAIPALIVFWLVLRFWHMRHTGPPKPPEQAELRTVRAREPHHNP
jgi:hypothetical protein